MTYNIITLPECIHTDEFIVNLMLARRDFRLQFNQQILLKNLVLDSLGPWIEVKEEVMFNRIRGLLQSIKGVFLAAKTIRYNAKAIEPLLLHLEGLGSLPRNLVDEQFVLNLRGRVCHNFISRTILDTYSFFYVTDPENNFFTYVFCLRAPWIYINSKEILKNGIHCS